MFRRIKRAFTERRLQSTLKEYPNIQKHMEISPNMENIDKIVKALDQHGDWIEETLQKLEKSKRKNVVRKFAAMARGYLVTNPEQLEKLKTIIQKQDDLPRVLAQVEESEDHREMVGQLVLYGLIKDEARRAEIQALANQLSPSEKHILWVKIHNHAMLRVPTAAPKAALNELAAKRPELMETVKRILGEQG